MKRNKKVIMAVSFCLGALMFVTTAFADMASKTGYDQLKDAVKLSAETLSEKYQSFTLEGNIIAKDNDKVLVSGNFKNKLDISGKKTEETSTTEFANGKKVSSFSYRDSECSIFYSSNEDKYYLTEFTGQVNRVTFPNPFKEEGAKDIEKIFDALVGNLKDYVSAEENADGSKEFSGSLSEAQIPALVNAVSSFGFKQAFANDSMDSREIGMPQLSDDVFVKMVKGKATTNKDGVVNSIFATGVLSGKDKSGNTHDLSIEILAKVVDINSTNIVKPDLKGKEVEKRTEKFMEEQTVSEKYLGKYKNEIVIEKDNQFVKIGERIVEISKIEGKNVSGRYYEEYKEKYSEYGKDKADVKFEGEIAQNSMLIEIKPVEAAADVQIQSISFDYQTAKLYLNYSTKSRIPFDGQFTKVFAD